MILAQSTFNLHLIGSLQFTIEFVFFELKSEIAKIKLGKAHLTILKSNSVLVEAAISNTTALVLLPEVRWDETRQIIPSQIACFVRLGEVPTTPRTVRKHTTRPRQDGALSSMKVLNVCLFN